jgi:hypothetical protein
MSSQLTALSDGDDQSLHLTNGHANGSLSSSELHQDSPISESDNDDIPLVSGTPDVFGFALNILL